MIDTCPLFSEQYVANSRKNSSLSLIQHFNNRTNITFEINDYGVQLSNFSRLSSNDMTST